jgi:hypothetical protein
MSDVFLFLFFSFLVASARRSIAGCAPGGGRADVDQVQRTVSQIGPSRALAQGNICSFPFVFLPFLEDIFCLQEDIFSNFAGSFARDFLFR